MSRDKLWLLISSMNRDDIHLAILLLLGWQKMQEQLLNATSSVKEMGCFLQRLEALYWVGVTISSLII